MKIQLLIVLCLLFLSACSPYQAGLQSLGSNNDFSDVEIADDFDSPEEESETLVDLDEDNLIDMEITPQLKNTFDMGTQLFSLANGKARRWEGCNKGKSSQGGYNSNSKCGRGYFHPSFAKNLNEVFFRCVSDAAEVGGYPQPARVFINHYGTYNDRNARNSSRKSNHAYARAWDIAHFNMYDKNGKHYKVSTFLRDYKGSQAKFYDEFRDCWRESLPSNCKSGKSEYKGSIGHKSSKLGGNTLHNDHIHLSYPLCAG